MQSVHSDGMWVEMPCGMSEAKIRHGFWNQHYQVKSHPSEPSRPIGGAEWICPFYFVKQLYVQIFRMATLINIDENVIKLLKLNIIT